MKALSFSRLYLVGALIIGLVVAWSAAAPQPARSWPIIGGCTDYCSDNTKYYCKDKGGECNDYCYDCVEDEEGEETCIRKATHCNCADPSDTCEDRLWNEDCPYM